MNITILLNNIKENLIIEYYKFSLGEDYVCFRNIKNME